MQQGVAGVMSIESSAYVAGKEGQLPSGEDLQSRVKELQLPAFNPSSSWGDSAGK